MEKELKEYLQLCHNLSEDDVDRIEKTATEDQLDVLRKGRQSWIELSGGKTCQQVILEFQQEQKDAREKAVREAIREAREERAKKKSQFALGFGFIPLVMVSAMLFKAVFNPPKDIEAEKQNATQIVSQWLEEDALSRDLIIYELMADGFSDEAASYAADNSGANWYDQAMRAAEDYLSEGQHTWEETEKMLQQKHFTYAQILHVQEQIG